jgi:hypothetical protein
MLESKKGSISLSVTRCPLVGDAAVSLSFKAAVNSCALNRLVHGWDCNCLPSGAEEACVCYAQFLVIQDVLCGSPLATSKSKVGSVKCVANDGIFSVCWTVKGTGSAVRKSIGMALKTLSPGKYYSVYQKCIKDIGGKAVREEFNSAADEICKAVKNEVTCCVVGNIKTTKEHVDAMVEVLSNKLVVAAVDGAKKKPSNHVACDHSELTELKTSGWHAYVVKEYIMAKARGAQVHVFDKYLTINANAKQWESLAAKLKKPLKDYVAQKFTKVGDELANVLGYLIIANGSAGAGEVKSLLKNGVKASDVESAINKVL